MFFQIAETIMDACQEVKEAGTECLIFSLFFPNVPINWVQMEIGLKKMSIRREFIKKSILWGGYALGAIALGIPVFSFIGFRKITEKKVTFPPDSQHAAVFKEGVYLMSSKDGLQAFSAKCPHLGCTVNFDAISKRFKCPCHGSMFDASGKWISGPAKKNLEVLPMQKKPNGDMETVIKV